MMLVTRPDYEPGVRYLTAWADELIADARRRSIDVVDLKGKKACRTEVEGRLRKIKPALVVLNGHGSDDSVTGQDGEILIQARDNAELLKGKVTYAVSCNSAAVLGEEVAMQKASTYIGYEKQFAILHSKAHMSHPISDPLAAPFRDFSNQIVKGLLKGHGAADCVNKAKASGSQKVNSLLSSVADPDTRAVARYLWWDIGCLVCKGDQEKRAA